MPPPLKENLLLFLKKIDGHFEALFKKVNASYTKIELIYHSEKGGISFKLHVDTGPALIADFFSLKGL